MGKKLTIEEMIGVRKDRVLLDVRTPAEYEKGHIPHARNLPLFSNEERAAVGTLYKQVSQEAALLRGLDLVGPKMRHFVEEAGRLAPEKRVMVHCWRGGQRSGSMGWLLNLAGFDVDIVQGGYKAYRNYIHGQFENRKLRMIILGGHTGSGKTRILHQLREVGEQLIDLEAIAHHKGSAFGALGEEPQPTVEQFENDLYEVFRRIDPGRRVWLENESRAIGRVYIPEGCWAQMNRAPLVHLEIPLEDRVAHLVEVYARYSRQDLVDSFERIRKRLGGQHLQAALQALNEDNYARAARIALHYYDKAYGFFVERRQKNTGARFFHQEVTDNDPVRIAHDLIKLANNHQL